MTRTRHAVAIYARISQDRSAQELGVTRQLQDCYAEAKRRGWTVADEYVDDDLSAYSGKRRPQYQRLLEDVSLGRRDAVIVWRLDRLHRQPRELEHFVEVCTRAEVGDVVSLAGEFDLGKSEGLFTARIMGAVAAAESQGKSERIRRKSQEIAEAGRPHMGGPRPFGFEADKVTHNAQEAEVIRQLAARALAGETLTSLATWLQETGVKTVGGKEWRTTTVRGLLTNGRIWGMRAHRGQILGPGVWEPIITAEQGERLRRKLLDPARRTNHSARRYLLSGLLICGKCGNRLHSTPRGKYRRYGCRKGADSAGCGGIFIYADKLEQCVAEAVLHRLDSPVMHQALTEDGIDQERARELAQQIDKDKTRLDDLATMWADGELSREEWTTARDRVKPRLEANRREFDRINHRDSIAEYIGHSAELRTQWATLNLSRQVAITKALLTSIKILPATSSGRHGVDLDRVELEWRR
ncbi:recombinase family protein [Kocuria rhizosphaericola]|uniref:recombinase family protein n=1 Tax=Kocuria rhizosphaericola TaxID=3376284 RepID=UPI0037AEF5E4